MPATGSADGPRWSPDSPRAVWIGLTDRNTEGLYERGDGSPVINTNWNPGEPNNLGNEDYVTMNDPAT